MKSLIIAVLFFIFNQEVKSEILSERGCVCKEQWNLYGVIYVGCKNPDNDPKGFWCIVQTQNCPNGNPGQIQSGGQGSGQYFDYCTPPVVVSSNGQQEEAQVQQQQQYQQQSPDTDLQQQFGRSSIVLDSPSAPYQVVADSNQATSTNIVQSSPILITLPQIQGLNIQIGPIVSTDQKEDCIQRTIGGCECMYEWQLYGNTYQGCQNLDNDSRGNWCMVKNGDSCSAGAPSKFISVASQGVFDYCDSFSDCNQIQDEAGIISSQVQPPAVFEGPCAETISGCKCLSEWTYDGDVDGAKVAYYGCAKTLDDSSEPWCPVDTSVSCITEPHSAQLGGNYSSWDYCHPKCTPPTQGSCSRTREGCDCLEFWNYDGKQQQGCTRPDIDANTWCVVDPETCTGSIGPTGQLPSTQEFWDFCDSSCT